MRSFITALQFLTRIHLVKQEDLTAEDFGRSTRFFPLVGVSALLELAGFAWWGAHLVSLMRPRSAPSPRALPSR